MLAYWLEDGIPADYGLAAERQQLYSPETFLYRMHRMPHLIESGLWPAQIVAIKNLERSLAENRPRALIQMATGSGKTFTAINFLYRLIKFGGAKRVLFLVDRGNLGRQALKEFQQYLSPYNNFKFTEEFIVQRLTSNTLDTTARVCICTIQRLYSMKKTAIIESPSAYFGNSLHSRFALINAGRRLATLRAQTPCTRSYALVNAGCRQSEMLHLRTQSPA